MQGMGKRARRVRLQEIKTQGKSSLRRQDKERGLSGNRRAWKPNIEAVLKYVPLPRAISTTQYWGVRQAQRPCDSSAGISSLELQRHRLRLLQEAPDGREAHDL